MKIAILETIVMPAGHEVEFDRILVNELKNQGHEPIFFVPSKFPFKVDYQTDIHILQGGDVISYAGVGRLKKIWLSLQRERRRINWFNSAYKAASDGKCDAIIVPTNSWRVMRSIRNSELRYSPIPILFMFHGIMPKDRNKFVKGIQSLQEFKNIHFGELGIPQEYPELASYPNFHSILPPIYTPVYQHSLSYDEQKDLHLHLTDDVSPIRLGFFGQYRREKNLEFFLKAFKKCKFTVPVELVVQGATVTKIDSDDFERISDLYKKDKNIEFVHKNLIGKDWEDDLLGVDIILMPYGAERYRYQPSAMLFTAIGFNKVVLQSPELSPEVHKEFNIGEVVQLDSVDVFAKQLEAFMNNFYTNRSCYNDGLLRARKKYGQDVLVEHIVNILQ